MGKVNPYGRGGLYARPFSLTRKDVATLNKKQIFPLFWVNRSSDGHAQRMIAGCGISPLVTAPVPSLPRFLPRGTAPSPSPFAAVRLRRRGLPHAKNREEYRTSAIKLQDAPTRDPGTAVQVRGFFISLITFNIRCFLPSWVVCVS